MLIVHTQDNSPTLFHAGLNETYHSRDGAIGESRHVFIEAGLKDLLNSKSQLHILEVGMGTGLNVLLTFLEWQNFHKQHKKKSVIHYTALEPYPIDPELLAKLEYTKLLNLSENIWNTIHAPKGENPLELETGFYFAKFQRTIQNGIPKGNFDLVYYDAFAPQKQPEMWNPDIFSQLKMHMNSNGRLVTYCAKGDVKRALKAANFSVETLQGFGHKREMIRAVS